MVATYRARWIVPVDQPPLENGMVKVANGRILSVGKDDGEQPTHDLGDAVLLPGLVNAHTHLEFSLLEKPLGEPRTAFPDWIARVVEHRRQQNKALFVETDGFQRFRRRAAEAGMAELRASGTAAFGDIATPGWPRASFPAEGLGATIFLELLGLEADQQDDLFATAQSFVLDLQDRGGRLRPGISPHAPYTVTPELVQRVCQLSVSERFPVAMHLAESREELELLASHSGRMVEVLESLGAWHADAIHRGVRPLDYLQWLSNARRALVIHGNYLVDDEVEFLASRRERMSVVYCPRTHAWFGHEPYPLEKMLSAGVRVAVGTDSRATNPNLRLIEELRYIAAHYPALTPEIIVKMGTLWAAEALGVAHEYGSLTPGKRARLASASVSADVADPFEAILNAEYQLRSLE